MKQKLTIIKVGGKIVEQKESLEALLSQFADVEGLKMLVHGGGRSATKIASQMGIESKMVDGRRITDGDMLEVVTMVYGGLVNKSIVSALQARGINSLGLTGADLNIVQSERRKASTVDYGFVGDVQRVDGRILASLIGQGIVPVIAPLTHDGQGQMLNTNADTIAGELAKALAEQFDVTLVYCFERAGVLRDESDDNSVILTIKPSDFDKLKEDGTIQGGMIPKLENAFQAISSGVSRVVITNSSDLLAKRGTTIEP
ncbi:MAG: acetylglutamate kinase [Bacteroidales bacterium]